MAAPTFVDLNPVLVPLLQAGTTVLVGLASWAVTRVLSFLHLNQQTALKQAVLDGIDRGINFGQNKVGALISAGVTVPVQNQVVAEAVSYVVQKFPGYMAKLGWTPEHISDLVLSKLPPPDQTNVAVTTKAA